MKDGSSAAGMISTVSKEIRIAAAIFLAASVAAAIGENSDVPWLYVAGFVVLALEFLMSVIYTGRHLLRVIKQSAMNEEIGQLDPKRPDTKIDESTFKHPDEHDWVPVTSSMYLRDAEVIENVLQDEGIPAKQATGNPQRYLGMAPQLDTAQVLVPKPLFEKALAALQKREAAAESGDVPF